MISCDICSDLPGMEHREASIAINCGPKRLLLCKGCANTLQQGLTELIYKKIKETREELKFHCATTGKLWSLDKG